MFNCELNIFIGFSTSHLSGVILGTVHQFGSNFYLENNPPIQGSVLNFIHCTVLNYNYSRDWIVHGVHFVHHLRLLQRDHFMGILLHDKLA